MTDPSLTGPFGVVIIHQPLRKILCYLPVGKWRELCEKAIRRNFRGGKDTNEGSILRLRDLQLRAIEEDIFYVLRCPDLNVSFFVPVTRDIDGIAVDLSRADEIGSVDKD